MKNLKIILCTCLLSGCQAQNNERSPQLNHLLSPIRTEVVFDFGEGLMKDTDFDLNYRMIMDPIGHIDTTLEMGLKQYKVVLLLGRPVVARLHLGDQWDHLYLVPGRSTQVIYNPLKENQDRIQVTGPKEVRDINEYYDARFRLLNVSRAILQAYQKFSRMTDPMAAKKRYDSLSHQQYRLLDQFSHALPSWFVRLEEMEIKYTGEVFKSSAIRRRNLMDKEPYMMDYLPFELHRDLNDTIGLLTDFYSWSLGELAYLTHCSEDCYHEKLEIRLPALNEAILAMSEDIRNREIRQVFLAQNLMRIYHSSQRLPDSLVTAFEKRLEKPYLDLVSVYKNPVLTGQKATSFYMADETGKFYTLEDFNGQVVLLNFWFVGCKPCEQEIPHEKKLVTELYGSHFKLVNICTNTPEQAWKGYVKENEMPGINLYAKGNWGDKLTQAYQVSSFPTYVLIDKDGTIAIDKAPRPSSDILIREIRAILE